MVIVDKEKYVENMDNFLSDQNLFQKNSSKMIIFLILLPGKKNALIKFIKVFLTLTACLKKYKDTWNQWESRPGIMYGSWLL